jgi:hypothetical protein
MLASHHIQESRFEPPIAFVCRRCGICLFAKQLYGRRTTARSTERRRLLEADLRVSESGGSFVSDNFVSSELAFQDVLTNLSEGRSPGGVYLGVGPEQNFTYIAALKPKIAFILDIRRQNMVEHLMYKALFEMSTDRADFLSRLFSRPRPPELGKESSAVTLFSAFTATADQELFQQTLAPSNRS